MDQTGAAGLNFVIGEERKLADILGAGEIEPLLRSALMAGLSWVSVETDNGLSLCDVGAMDGSGKSEELTYPLLIEGEPQGSLRVCGDSLNPATRPLASLLRDTLQMMLNNNLKRMLTTETHSVVVQQSYEELLQTNQRLAESESRYRKLAASLELMVEERTGELQKAYCRMLQQEKLASIGQLAAGMAHEINNPTGFILSNLTSFRKYFSRMREMLNMYRSQSSMVGSGDKSPSLQAEERWRALKLDYVLDDTDVLLSQSIEGAERIKQIVAGLKSFSHLDDKDSGSADLIAELERTLAVLSPQFPDDTTVSRDFSPVPPLPCSPSLICQAFLAILQNSLQSRHTGLELRLSCRCEHGRVTATLADNGCGIDQGLVSRVFDPFFTTRDVGDGTGMGLTMARDIILSCGGEIELESEIGRGTVVTISFPAPPPNSRQGKG